MNEPELAVATQEPVPTRHPRIVLSNISKRYGPVRALTEVALEVAAGEVHALLGENGAGKSTLMNVASGTVTPDRGTIEVDGALVDHLTPSTAAQLGIAIVHQHPALLPDMTVAENVRVALPQVVTSAGRESRVAIRRILDEVDFQPHLEDRVDSLSVVDKHLLELAKALAVRPGVLILDEPTAPLDQEAVEMMFGHVRQVAAGGSAVIYITHRLAEVRLIADRVTILRDGEVRGVSHVDAITDDEVLGLIIGRRLDSAFPPKAHVSTTADPILEISDLEGNDFTGISLSARAGEIVGVAGIVGNGQSELLRALAGLERFSGAVSVAGARYGAGDLRAKSAYMPPDRNTEALMMSLTVRENAAVSALRRFTRGPFVSRTQEIEHVSRELSALNTRVSGIETPVSALSGGNQQKVVMARTLLSEPAILVADEPTQGVDVGARAEIYRILRSVSAGGVPVVVASSDALELQGLCDRVIVLSRGYCVAELAGDDVTEEAIVNAAMRAERHQRGDGAQPARRTSSAVTRFIRGDYAPVAVLALLMIALGAYIYVRNDRYLSAFNTTSVMLLCTALGFIAMGQTIAMLLGGIDLSVGPLSGLLVVVGSFFINDGRAGPVMIFGLALMAFVAAGVGLINGSLVQFLKFTPVAATLATYIALQGFAFVLRDAPGGLINRDVTDIINTTIGRVPVAFIIFVVATIAMEAALRYRRWGLDLRATGSDAESARKIGVGVTWTVVLGYVAVSLFVFAGAILLLAQLGIGDPAQGEGFTLNSITAVVLGGTMLRGGRGTFIGTLLGTGLIVQIINGATFLRLTQASELLYQGLLIVAAAVIYSQIRRRGVFG
jgi:ABC-type sugar transport system ATPase subunit/ribose/xylose/arabinose/galactoside ABC-type transport system permease subunit